MKEDFMDDHELLITKKLSDELTQKEEEAFTSLLQSSPEFQSKFASIQNHWNAFNEKDYRSDANTEAELAKLNAVLFKEKKSSAIQWYMSSAAVVLICFFLLFNSEEPFSELSTGRGKISTLNLVDGSTVQVNKLSHLVYFTSDNVNERRIKLKGEAFFKVSKGTKPFIVETEHATIKVLGTEFNIKSVGHKTVLTVTEGKVEFSNNMSPKSAKILTKDQSATSFQSTISDVETVKSKDLWVHGKITFRDDYFQDVLKELERIFNVSIQVQNTSQKAQKISAQFTYDQGIEFILQELARTVNLSSQKRSEHIYLIH